MEFGSFRASVENSYLKMKQPSNWFEHEKFIVKCQEQFDLLKPDLKTQIQGVVTSEFDHAEFFALAWAAVGLESKFEGRLLVSGRDESNF